MFKSIRTDDPYEWLEKDWELRYRGRIIGVKWDGEIIPRIFIKCETSMKEGGIVRKVTHMDLCENSTQFSMIEDCILDIPDSCYVNEAQAALYVSVHRRKSQKRSVSFGDLSFDRAFPAIRVLPIELGSMAWAVKGMYNPLYPSFIQALRLIESGEMLSCAFDKEFCLGPHYNQKGLAIEYNRVYIARYHNRVLYMPIRYSFLKEKLQNFSNMEIQIV